MPDELPDCPLCGGVICENVCHACGRVFDDKLNFTGAVMSDEDIEEAERERNFKEV